MKYKPYVMKDVMDASAQNKFNVISLFAGGGGSSTGYRLAGGNVLCVNEFVEAARDTYRENYPYTKILSSDIKISEILYSVSPDFFISKSNVSVICFSETLIFLIITLNTSFSQRSWLLIWFSIVISGISIFW